MKSNLAAITAITAMAFASMEKDCFKFEMNKGGGYSSKFEAKEIERQRKNNRRNKAQKRK